MNALSAGGPTVQGAELTAGAAAGGGTVVVPSISNARGVGQAVETVDTGVRFSASEVSLFQTVTAAATADELVGSVAAEGTGYVPGQRILSGIQEDAGSINTAREAGVTADSVLDELVAALLSSRSQGANRATAQNLLGERVMIVRAGRSGVKSSGASGAAVPTGPMSRLGDLLLVGAFCGLGSRSLATRTGRLRVSKSSGPAAADDSKAPRSP